MFKGRLFPMSLIIVVLMISSVLAGPTLDMGQIETDEVLFTSPLYDGLLENNIELRFDFQVSQPSADYSELPSEEISISHADEKGMTNVVLGVSPVLKGSLCMLASESRNSIRRTSEDSDELISEHTQKTQSIKPET